MKINKFKKYDSNKYKVLIDNIEYVLYDDVILKYNLLFKKDIDESFLNNVMVDNFKSSIYDIAVKYINKKMRFEKEVYEFLKEKKYDEDDILSTIQKLKYNNLINDLIVSKAFINDKLLLTNYGPKKIISELVKYNVFIDNMNIFDNELIIDRLNKIIDKEIKLNIKLPKNKIINKIYIKCINLGYDKAHIDEVLSNKSISSNSNIENDYNKLYNKYKDKYDSNKLKYVLKNKLYQKGYCIEDVNMMFSD